MSDLNAEGLDAALSVYAGAKGNPDEIARTIRAYLASLSASEGRDVETNAMRKFVADARVWLDSRLENAKPEWMVAQLPAVEAAIRAYLATLPPASEGMEAAAAHLELTANSPSGALRLAYGEMTAQEIRTVRAVLTQQANAIRALTVPKPVAGWQDQQKDTGDRKCGEWLPIETAPKNGDDILVARFDEDNWYAVAQWWVASWAFMLTRGQALPSLLAFEPTHWQPLPADPPPPSRKGEP